MRGSVRNPNRSRVTALTATYKVRFGEGNGDGGGNGIVVPSGKIPRVTRLLGLAHRIEGLIRTGEMKDWAEAARLIGVTRARMTQIANLLLLAPGIQEIILNLLPVVEGRDYVKEHNLRSVVVQPEWGCQRSAWDSLQAHAKLPLPGFFSIWTSVGKSRN